MLRFIKLNKARCNRCSETLISKPEAPSVKHTCGCGKLTMSGGATHLLRTGEPGQDYIELSVFDFDGCPDIKEDVQTLPPNIR